ncbi:MAG: bifunctional phosphoglucose/phosphomannose isomerase [Actinomycetota bacterium]
MIDLDDVPAIKGIDTQDFLSHLESFPEQVQLARRIGEKVEGLPASDGLTSIAVLGMGGSGISGDVLGVALGPSSPLFVGAIKGYELPAWVGPNTLVFAATYSGKTEETLQTFQAARDRGARVLFVSAEQARAAPSFAAAVVPGGLQPRAALGYLAIPMLVICQRMGLGNFENDLDESEALLDRRRQEFRRESPAAQNPAKQLAQRLAGLIPIVYGAEGISEVAAYRWKCQFNECAKTPSYHNSFSELGHNELAGWGQLGPLTQSCMALVVLRHQGEDPRISARIEASLPMIEGHFKFIHQVSASGQSSLSRLLDLIYLGDFTASYLGLAQGVDPGPIDKIENLKIQVINK